MIDEALIEYLAKMDNKSTNEFIQDRQGKLKAIDNLRIFYVAQYEAKQNVMMNKEAPSGRNIN